MQKTVFQFRAAGAENDRQGSFAGPLVGLNIPQIIYRQNGRDHQSHHASHNRQIGCQAQRLHVIGSADGYQSEIL